MALKALIFDFDGVIVDSETPEYQIWQEICARFGVDIPLQDWEKGMGSSLDAFDPLVYLEKRIGSPIDREALKQEHRHRLLTTLSHQPPLPGISETIQAARAIGIRVAVASSSGIDWVKGNLDRLNLAACFDVYCTSEDVELVKPDPALYRLALDRLGVTADQAIAIEDSPNGVRAARSAGIYCIGIPTPVSAGLDLTMANMILPSLAHLRIEELATLIR